MKKLILVLGLMLVFFSFIFSQEQKREEIRLTLNDCLLKALENNFDISVEAFNPEIREFSIRESKETFMPQLGFSYDNFNQNYPSNWYAEGEVISSKLNTYSFDLTQRIITGGEITLSLSNQTSDTTRRLTIINPTYSGNLSLNFSQPLLKNFGPKINRRNITIAQNQRDISVYNLKLTLIQKVYEVEEAYWNLVLALETLKVREYSLEQSRERLRRTQEAARIGTKGAIDVLLAETEVANWEDSILYSRLQVEKAEDRLRKILNLPDDASGISRSILPLDKPEVERIGITFEEALKTALEERPERAMLKKEIKNSGLDVSYFRNQLLPQLDLRFHMWYPGQSGDIIIYQDNDPYKGIVIGKTEGSRMDAFKDVFRLKYDNWSVTLNLNIPLQNFLSRASLARAKMQREQKLLEEERQKESISFEISEVFKELKNNEKRMETTSRYRELMEKKLEAEEQRYRLGLAGSEWLFTYQRDLASAKAQEIGAIIDYKISVAKLERYMGVNFKSRDLRFRDYDF